MGVARSVARPDCRPVREDARRRIPGGLITPSTRQESSNDATNGPVRAVWTAATGCSGPRLATPMGSRSTPGPEDHEHGCVVDRWRVTVDALALATGIPDVGAMTKRVPAAGGPLPNQRMKLSWRDGRLKGKRLVMMAAAAPQLMRDSLGGLCR